MPSLAMTPSIDNGSRRHAHSHSCGQRAHEREHIELETRLYHEIADALAARGANIHTTRCGRTTPGFARIDAIVANRENSRGVPVRRPAPRYLATGTLDRERMRRAELVGLPRQLPKDLEHRKVPVWSEEGAYQHAIVMGNNGVILNRTVAAGNALDSLRLVVEVEAGRWRGSSASRPGT